VDTTITATFSGKMDASTITTSTFVVSDDFGNIAGTVTYTGTTATFTPATDLDYKVYTATITTGARDLSGNALLSDCTWAFSTLTDTTPPAVNSTTPANGSNGVAINSAISVAFSEAMDPATINASTFILNDGVSNILGTVGYNGTTATFTPSSTLSYDTTFNATITSDATDLAGNPLQADYTWSFTTGSEPDTTPPAVNSTTPANGSNGVAINSAISVAFSEAMDPATINVNTITLNNGITGTVIYDANTNTATFTPTNGLDYNTTYAVTITTGAKDLSGNSLPAEYGWSFHTSPTGNSGGNSVSAGNSVQEAKQLTCFISCAGSGLGMSISQLWLLIVIGFLLIKEYFSRKNKKRTNSYCLG
jgi:methionine-rich copper-binding protein CopC